jgi:hypothetical protein
MASEAERYLRNLAVERLRVLMPDARIIHELNVDIGQCRVDLAAVTESRIVFVEIKSRKDKLDRLKEQVRRFGPCCHALAVCYSSEKWNWSSISAAGGYGFDHWPCDKASAWTIDHWHRNRPPSTNALLELLWQAELEAEAFRAGLVSRKRIPRDSLKRALWENLTGLQVVEAVCRQLRRRPFAEADAAITESLAA